MKPIQLPSPEYERVFIKREDGKYAYKPYYHGSRAGLSLIVPAIYAGHQSTPMGTIGHRSDRVYITNRSIYAAVYAVAHEEPAIYEVVPFGELVQGSTPMVFTCDHAEVINEIRLDGEYREYAKQCLRKWAHLSNAEIYTLLQS